MKSMSKPSGTRMHRASAAQPVRSSAGARAHGARRKLREEPAEDRRRELAASQWDAIEEDIDLNDFDYNALDAEDPDGAGTDWLADRDLAMEIAQRALH